MQSYWDRIKPWTCAACGRRNISANETVCPACYAVRGETEPNREAMVAAAGAQRAGAGAATSKPGQVTRTYAGERAMQKGIRQMAGRGWRVVSQSSYQPRAGLGRIALLGGFGALVFKPKARFVVVFER